MQDDDEESGELRPFWSGTVAFGLLSLPVNLFVASRRKRVALRMLDEDGTPLSRRYICSKDDEPLDSDELVRGIEVKENTFVEIDDEELEALAPEKSREINLRRFVPLEDIDPLYFERAYFLVPEEGAQKAYRLLAASMQDMGRAGIATFVMRGKEYLVAIISERGILRAETLRFQDELRSPDDIGLPSLAKVDKKRIDQMKKAIADLAADAVNQDELVDDNVRDLQALVEAKLAEGEDIKHPPNLPPQETAQIIDLMQVLKRSLEQKSAADTKDERKPKNTNTKSKKSEPKTSNAKTSKATAGKDSAAKEQAGAVKKSPKSKPSAKTSPVAVDKNSSKGDLYKLATKLDIPGRSQMNKTELIRALQHH
jgi:DNA end-binding protein Ku